MAIRGFYLGRESTGSARFNRVAGLDLRLTPRRALEIEAFAMRSETSDAAGDWAGRTGLRVDTNAHRVRAGLLHVGDAFRRDLGFVRRRSVGTAFGGYERIVRPANPAALIREQSVGATVELTSDDRYDRLLTRLGSASYGLQLRDGGTFTVRANTTLERLDAPFAVGQLRISPGEYSFDTVRAEFRSDPSAVVSGNASVEAGEFWNGTQRLSSGSVRVRLDEHVAVTTSLSRNVIDLPQGSFAANLVGLRLAWSFNPQMFLNTFVQYNGETDSWLSNWRFNLIHRPLSDIYVVWNESRTPTVTQRALLLKYTQLIAF